MGERKGGRSPTWSIQMEDMMTRARSGGYISGREEGGSVAYLVHPDGGHDEEKLHKARPEGKNAP